MVIRTLLVGFGLAMAAVSSQAGAAEIDPRCAVMSSMHEKIACTCALQNGGWVRHIHGVWRYNYARPHMDSVHQCVKAAGG
jgi:hypothetical protein